MVSDISSGKYARLIEFMRFLVTGSIAAFSNLIARYLLDFVLPFEVAVVLAYLVGMVIAFILFQRTIFGDPGTSQRQQIIRFTLVNMLGLGIALLVSYVLARHILPAINWTLYPFDIAHFIGVCLPAFTSYFLHKHYTYA